MEDEVELADLRFDDIWNGTPCREEKHLDQLRREFIRRLSNEEEFVTKGMNKCRNELERLQFVQKLFEWIPVPNEYFQYTAKSCRCARYFLARGREELHHQCFQDAIRALNLAVMFSETRSIELSHSYALRCKGLHKIGEFRFALRDAECAKDAISNDGVSSAYEKSRLLQEIENIFQDCMHQIESSPNYNKKYNPDFMEGDNEVQLKDYCEKNYFQLQHPHPIIECAEDIIDINWKDGRGRVLQANCDVKAGTLLASEKPFSSLLRNTLKWDTWHCAHCCKPILIGIPCPDCSMVLYCSTECREEIVNVHKYECPCLSYLTCTPTALRDLFAIRIVISIGTKGLTRLSQNPSVLFQDESAIDTSSLPGFDLDGHYRSNSIFSVFNLVSHNHLFTLPQLLSDSFKALVYTNLLDQVTDFFNCPNSAQIKDLAAGLILRFIENIPFNAISLSKLINVSEPFDQNIDTESYSMGLFGLLSLSNHSCDPNAILLRHPSSPTISLVALKNLKKDEEICICYCASFSNQTTEERRQFLQSHYKFECQCPACVQNWTTTKTDMKSSTPKTKKLPGNHQKIIKKECTCKNPGIKSKSPLNICEPCQWLQRLDQSDKLISKGCLIEALHILNECLHFATEKFPSYCNLTRRSQDQFKRALVWLVNSYSCK